MSVDAPMLHSETFEELSDVIERDGEAIIQQWAAQVADVHARADERYRAELRDRLPSFLRSMAASLRSSDSEQLGAHRLQAVEHGEQRWSLGWKLSDLVRDYQILRIVLIDHLTAVIERPMTIREVLAIGLLLDEAIAAAVVMYVAYDERKLSEAEARIREVMDSVPDGIVVVDSRGIITMLNPAVERIFGRSGRELLGCPFQALIGLSEAYAGGSFWESPSAPPGIELPLRSQMRGHRGDGTMIDLEIAVCRFNRGDEALSIALVRDVTEQKRLEDELKQNARELEKLNQSLAKLTADAGESNRAKSDFLAKMSHEIRTPMTAILGYVELLGLQLRAPDQLQAIDTIKRNANFLVDIINDVLDLAKIEARKFDVELAPVAPLEIVDEIVALMTLPASEKGIRLVSTYDQALTATLESDAKRLKQILLNLVGNAIKFTDAGEVEIAVSLVRGPQRNEIAFAIHDTGIGMSTAELQRMFEPFAQGGGNGSQRPGGTGLGLTISKHLAELLGGRFESESAPGVGSTFRLLLPLREQLPDAAGQQPAAAPRETTSPPAAAAAPLRCRVLIADDRADHRTVIAQFLRSSGATVVVVDNGLTAVEIALEAEQTGSAFDVVLMDMRMPELDGYQATAKIRAAGSSVPIIALTASAMLGDHQQCLAVGCNDYLPKPIDFAVLIERVARYAPQAERG